MLAASEKVFFIDTSCAYGSSESSLGKSALLNQFNIITKTPTYSKRQLTNLDALHLRKCFFQSLSYLSLDSVYGLLIHSATDLLTKGSEYLFDEMLRLKSEKRIRKIGVSVYRPFELIEISKKFPIELVQLPLNVFDQSFLHSGLLKELAKGGVEVHARSIFLQGTLLRPGINLPKFLEVFKKNFIIFNDFCNRNNVSPLEACLSFVNLISEVGVALVGVHSASQLHEILQVFNAKNSLSLGDFYLLATKKRSLIDPRSWSDA